MFLIVEHPFADLRAFLGNETGRLEKTLLPLAVPENMDFIRSIGAIKRRARGGIEEWASEDRYADAALALRFTDQLRTKALGPESVGGSAQHTTRRVYCDGMIGRFQIGIKIRLTNGLNLTPYDWRALIRDTLQIPVRVKSLGGVIQHTSLADAGKPLAAHYLRSTTGKSCQHKVASKLWWTLAASPLLIIDHSDYPLVPPDNRRTVSCVEGIDLSHAWLKAGSTLCSAWFMASNGADPHSVRQLRIHLARLHAEREGLRLVITQILDDSKLGLALHPERSDAVQHYLNNALKSIQRPVRFGLDQSAIFDAAHRAYDFAFQGSVTTLLHMRRQVANKVDGYIARSMNASMVINNIQGDLMNTHIQMGDVTVQGDFTFVTARNIEGSFNKVQGAQNDTELHARLKQANLEVARLVGLLPPDTAELVSKDLEVFTAELTSTHPRKEWYELSAKGILAAATTVAQMTMPVTTAVQAVLALFL